MKTWADYGITVPNHGGNERYTICPQCSPGRKRANQNKKCLSLNVEKEVWCCHHCGWAGSLKSGQYNGKENHWKAPQYRIPDYDAYKGLSHQAIHFFQKRGIEIDVVKRNNITTGSVYMPQLEDFINTIQFPFYRDGQCINVKYRDHQKNFRLEAQAERIFYGLDDADEFTVIVEGEMDKLAVETAGFKACMSVPDGAPAPDSKNYSSKFEFLENSKEKLEKVKLFAIAVDSDAPGRRLEEELLHRLGGGRCTLVRWPEGCKDANETLQKCGPGAVADCIQNAEPPTLDGVVAVRDIMGRLEEYYNKGMAPGMETGWANLAKLYRVSLGEWTLVTGIPSHGKSEFLDALLINLANRYDWCFAYYSPENLPIEQHIAKLLEKQAGKPFRASADWIRMSMGELRETAQWINRHFFFLQLGEDNLPLETILEIAKNLIFQAGVKGLVIDPWNEIEHNRPSHLTETEYINRCLSGIRNFARSHNIHIWVVAHPTKLQKDAKGNDPIPSAYDVSGSAHWRNKADNILCVWRDVLKREEPVQIHVQKVRFKKNGRPGHANLNYDNVTGRFTDAPMLENQGQQPNW